MKGYKTVDEYIEGHPEAKEQLSALREIILTTELEETVKWGSPVYTYDGKNLVGLGAFKSYIGLWFFQGALLEDRKGKLINAQEGRTKALRQWRFSPEDEIDAKLVKAYVEEAIQNQREGREIKPVKKKKLIIPPQLADALKENSELKKCFEDFPPGKRREFANYIAEAKREETKSKRLEKIIPMILEKRGLHDKYR